MGLIDDIATGVGIGGSVLSMATAPIAAKNQRRHQLALMQKQYEYNEKTAENNQERNKEMWDYTNYENQVKHARNAGLSIGLLYGQGGGQGMSATGAQAEGTGQPTDKGTEAAQRQQQIGLQMADIAATVELKKAQAKEAEAEADKKKGVDTDLAKSITKLNEALAITENMKTEEVAAKIKYWGDASVEMFQSARKHAAEADILEGTKENEIQKSAYEAYNTMLQGLETISKINLNEEQTKAIGENLAIAWYNAGTNRMNATTAADHVANELLNITGKLDIEQERLLKDWIYQGINAGMQIFEGITDIVKIKALIKSLAKGVKEVTTKTRSSKGKTIWQDETIKEIFKE